LGDNRAAWIRFVLEGTDTVLAAISFISKIQRCHRGTTPRGPSVQAPLSVVDDNRKVVGALSVVGASIIKIVSKFQHYFPDFLKKNQNFRKSAGIPSNSGEIP
jgi:hypothetical protein